MEKMKLAIINARGRFFSLYFLEGYKKSGIDYDFATSLEEFLEEHPNLNDYSGVLMHPTLGYHKKWLEQIQKDFPKAKVAFATTNLESTLQEMEVVPGVPLLEFYNVTSIKRYFKIE